MHRQCAALGVAFIAMTLDINPRLPASRAAFALPKRKGTAAFHPITIHNSRHTFRYSLVP